jgi:hypothetical protein
MHVTTSSARYDKALREHLQKKIDKLSSDILRGVLVDVYKERCAELRAVTDLVAELPSILKKASD